MKKIKMRKRYLYTLIVILGGILLLTIVRIVGFPTESSIYGNIFVSIVFFAFIGFFIKTIRDYKEKTKLVWWLLWPIIAWTLYIVIGWVVYFATGII